MQLGSLPMLDKSRCDHTHVCVNLCVRLVLFSVLAFPPGCIPSFPGIDLRSMATLTGIKQVLKRASAQTGSNN